MDPWIRLAELNAGDGRPQYGTSMHYPDCWVNATGCTGCLPPVLEGEVVGPDEGPLHGWIPGTVWDAARVVDGWAEAMHPAEVVFGVDVAGVAQGEDRAIAFTRIRDGLVGVVHVPDVFAGRER